MSEQMIYVAIFVALAMLYLGVGIRSSQRVKNSEDYYLGGRKMGVLQVSANLIATQLGGGVILGSSALAYKEGLNGLFYTVGIVLGMLALGCGLAGKLQALKVTTVAQALEVKFQSKRLRQFAALLSIVTLFGILCAQVICIKGLVATLGFPTWSVIVVWLFITSYTLLGGMRAITINDMIQLVVIFSTFGFVFLTFYFQPGFDFASTLQNYRFENQTSHFNWSTLLAVALPPALFCVIEQDIAQRFFASATKIGATLSALIAGIALLLFGVIPVYFGMIAKVIHVPIAQDSNPLLVLLGSHGSKFLFGFVISAVFAAIISTADALMNGIGANISEDFNWKTKSENQKLMLSKKISLIVGLGSLLVSFFIDKGILDILLISYEVSICGLFVPVLYAYFLERPSRMGAYFSIVTGIISFLVIMSVNDSPLNVIYCVGLAWISYQIGKIVGANEEGVGIIVDLGLTAQESASTHQS